MKIIIPFVLCIAVNVALAQATDQSKSDIPTCLIKTIEGTPFNTTEIENGELPFVICFWQGCCKNNLNFMDSFSALYEDYSDEMPFKVFAISVDDSRSSSLVKSMVNGKGWEFDFYLDPNSEFMRSLNVSITPHCIIFDKHKKLVWQKSGFMQGDEVLIFEEIKKLDSGK